MINELKLVEKELENDITSKLDLIKEKMLTGEGPKDHARLSMLSMINDELTDVLLNFESRYLDSDFDTD